jgi:hypothetical protein
MQQDAEIQYYDLCTGYFFRLHVMPMYQFVHVLEYIVHLRTKYTLMVHLFD